MRGARLKILRGPGQGAEFYIPIDTKVYVGRGKTCHFRLEDEEASRKHCVIASRPGEYVIRDLDSTYGTLINDYPITKSVLEEDDRLTVGETEIGFNLVDEVPEKFVEIAARSRSELTDSVFDEVSEEDLREPAADDELAPEEVKYQLLDVKCEKCKRVFYNLRWRPGMTCRGCGSAEFNPVISFEKDEQLQLEEQTGSRKAVPIYKQRVPQLIALSSVAALVAIVIVARTFFGGSGGSGLTALYLVPGTTRLIEVEDGGRLPPYVSASGGKNAFRAYYCVTCQTLFPYGPKSGKEEDYSSSFHMNCPNPACGEKRDSKKHQAFRNHTQGDGVKIWDGTEARPLNEPD